jgi:hypothetical protein
LVTMFLDTMFSLLPLSIITSHTFLVYNTPGSKYVVLLRLLYLFWRQ